MSSVNVDARGRCDIGVGDGSLDCREVGLDRLEDRPHEDRRSALGVGVCKGDQSLVSGTLMEHHNQRDDNCNGCIFHNDTRLAKHDGDVKQKEKRKTLNATSISAESLQDTEKSPCRPIAVRL